MDLFAERFDCIACEVFVFIFRIKLPERDVAFGHPPIIDHLNTAAIAAFGQRPPHLAQSPAVRDEPADAAFAASANCNPA